MRPSEYTFASLIAIDGNQWHYHIPRFQREYVWGKANWSKLIEDIYENDPGHYMGSIICVHDEEDELSPDSELIYEVIDGQQRLTTISLLLAAIYKKITALANADLKVKETVEFIIKSNGIQRRLVKEVKPNNNRQLWGYFKSGTLRYCLRVQPSTQGLNLVDYQYILKEIGLLPDITYPKYIGNRRIYKAYVYFLEHIPETLLALYDLLERIYALSFIHITEPSQSKAFMLFETLNYRGVPLSAIDIIKNKMLATLGNKYSISVDDAYDQWQKLLENLPEDRDQDRFLRHFYNAFKHNPKIKIEKISRATGSTLITIYESLIKRDAKWIFDELIEKAKIYNQFIEPEKYGESRLTNALLDLDRIGAAPASTFLLYLFSLPEEFLAEPDLKEKVVELLCKYYLRRNITDFPNTRDLDAINIDLVDQCVKEICEGRSLTYSFISDAILNGKGRPSSLDTFVDALRDNLYFNNDYMARYALIRLNDTYNTKEYLPNLWERNEKGLFVWTVEHIFPQGENIPKEWVDIIANGDQDEAERIRSEKVHCLGNLTLSGYNSQLSNQAFDKKREKSVVTVFGTKISIGYKNGLALNNIVFPVNRKILSLATTEQWTAKHIDARNEVMVNLLVQLFKFEGE